MHIVTLENPLNLSAPDAFWIIQIWLQVYFPKLRFPDIVLLEDHVLALPSMLAEMPKRSIEEYHMFFKHCTKRSAAQWQVVIIWTYPWFQLGFRLFEKELEEEAARTNFKNKFLSVTLPRDLPFGGGKPPNYHLGAELYHPNFCARQLGCPQLIPLKSYRSCNQATSWRDSDDLEVHKDCRCSMNKINNSVDALSPSWEPNSCNSAEILGRSLLEKKPTDSWCRPLRTLMLKSFLDKEYLSDSAYVIEMKEMHMRLWHNRKVLRQPLLPEGTRGRKLPRLWIVSSSLRTQAFEAVEGAQEKTKEVKEEEEIPAEAEHSVAAPEPEVEADYSIVVPIPEVEENRTAGTLAVVISPLKPPIVAINVHPFSPRVEKLSSTPGKAKSKAMDETEHGSQALGLARDVLNLHDHYEDLRPTFKTSELCKATHEANLADYAKQKAELDQMVVGYKEAKATVDRLEKQIEELQRQQAECREVQNKLGVD
ncbi:unnamed protein product [Prunus armeniaca]